MDVGSLLFIVDVASLRGSRLGRDRRLLLPLALVCLGLMLSACASGNGAAEPDAVDLPTEEAETRLTGVKGVLAETVSRLAAAPLIGRPFQKLLSRLAPEDHWCVGGVLLVLLVLLVAAVSSAARD